MSTDQSSIQPQQRSIRPLLFALLILCLLMGASYIGRLRNLAMLDQQIAAAELSVEQARSRQQSLRDEHARQQDAGADMIDQTARRDLNLVQPGDLTFTVMTPVPSSLPEAPPKPVIESEILVPLPKPNWQQWMELLFPN